MAGIGEEDQVEHDDQEDGHWCKQYSGDLTPDFSERAHEEKHEQDVHVLGELGALFVFIQHNHHQINYATENDQKHHRTSNNSVSGGFLDKQPHDDEETQAKVGNDVQAPRDPPVQLRYARVGVLFRLAEQNKILASPTFCYLIRTPSRQWEDWHGKEDYDGDCLKGHDLRVEAFASLDPLVLLVALPFLHLEDVCDAQSQFLLDSRTLRLCTLCQLLGETLLHFHVVIFALFCCPSADFGDRVSCPAPKLLDRSPHGSKDGTHMVSLISTASRWFTNIANRGLTADFRISSRRVLVEQGFQWVQHWRTLSMDLILFFFNDKRASIPILVFINSLFIAPDCPNNNKQLD